jgi:uncharacterized membrane protein YhaH (DUF805 family)
MNWYLYAMRRGLRDLGRSSRPEFWYFNLLFTIFSIIAGVADAALFGDEHQYIGVVLTLVHVIPFVAVSTRRMHDIDRTGWWQLLPPVLLILACFRGTSGPNRFGPEPKSIAQASAAAQAPLPSPDTGSGDVIGEIERLAALRAAGGLSDAEYEALKAEAFSRGRQA